MKQEKRKAVSRALRGMGDKDKILAWRRDLNRILQVFNVCSIYSVLRALITTSQTELVINTHVLVADIHRLALGGQEDNTSGQQPVSTAPGCQQ